jgi:hypothetical protein
MVTNQSTWQYTGSYGTSVPENEEGTLKFKLARGDDNPTGFDEYTREPDASGKWIKSRTGDGITYQTTKAEINWLISEEG